LSGPLRLMSGYGVGETLSREAGEETPPADLTRAQASERIDALQQQTGRGA
jgi:hypothetical protein